MKVLITGFDPFGGETVNPAFEAVKLLPDTIAGAEVVKLEIPTVFTRSAKVIEAAMEKEQPDVVINVGQAGSRSCITIERVGINLAEARIPDNDGDQPMGRALQEDGENAYFATIPVMAAREKVREAGIPCHISYTAGTYVCNAVMYNVLHLCATKFPGVRAGFVHVPFASSQAVNKPNGTPFMALTEIARALEEVITACVENNSDITAAAGNTH